jgi:hypothetical protein
MGEEIQWIIWQTQQYNSYMEEDVPLIIWQTQQYNSYMGEEVPWISWQTQHYNSYMGEDVPWIIWQTQQTVCCSIIVTFVFIQANHLHTNVQTVLEYHELTRNKRQTVPHRNHYNDGLPYR